MVDDGIAAQLRDQLADDLERETKNLQKRLADVEKEAASNRSAAQILTQFIENGDAELNDDGQVKLIPNRIRNEESAMEWN